MKTNKLLIAAAGSGKTTYIINRACQITNEPVLITTYTEANDSEIKRGIIKKKGYIPSNITIQTWFSFLMQHGVKPYQSIVEESIHHENIRFVLTNKNSGFRYYIQGRPVYWGEDNPRKHYFTDRLEIYSDKLAKFVFNCNKKSRNQIIDRISRLFIHIYIDEVQDLAGYDLELIKLFFKSPSSTLLVGDPRQVTYLTNHSQKYEKYSNGLIKEFIKNELEKSITCEIDEKTLNVSHRNHQLICDYSAKLFPCLPIPTACNCDDCRKITTDHEGVFLIKPSDVEKYLFTYNPVQLRWSISTYCNSNFQAMNFGESKGMTFERVLIYPTQEMAEWVRNNHLTLKDETRAKLYVGITRARRSVGIVLDFRDDEIFDGIIKFTL